MEEQNQDDEVGRVVREAGGRAARTAGKAAGKWAGKKVLKLTIVSGGGCLIPLVLIIILMFTGIVSASTVSKKYDYEEIKKEAAQEDIPPKEYLFNELYSSATGELGFTENELDSMVFDKKSLKRMFDLIAEYNEKELKKKLKVELTASFSVPTSYRYEADYNGDGEYTSISKNAYLHYEETGPDFDYRRVPKTWREETRDVEKEIIIDNTWIRGKYPVDWQIVYLLCFYDSFDNGASSTEFAEDGKKIRLKKKYIKDMIEEIASDEVTDELIILSDISADCIWNTFGEEEEKHYLDALSYDWGLGKITQEEIMEEYGAYMPVVPFESPIRYYEFRYTAVVSGNIPTSRLKGVQTLITYDEYDVSEDGSQDVSNLVSSTYDLTKLELLLERYGHGRDMKAFIAALKELPGGEDVAAEIELAILEIKERGE